ncbi:DUF4145 domain-containing protein [Duganella fentianensis]|uniref:DUF4145 domain-containing protein n=1 Tax=Duganella fentianensis TaxID=2692177 RepID=UPI0032B19E91
MVCPACNKGILILSERSENWDLREKRMIYPRTSSRPLAPVEVPSSIAEDFNEACLVLDDSPKASAALSRRCLQAILRDKGYTQKDLAPAIAAAIASNTLPSELAESLDAVRNIGNFAAHPMKDTSSGAVLPVELHEAEWNLEVLESLFDFYYVAPALLAAKKAALNQKLAAANKPLIK